MIHKVLLVLISELNDYNDTVTNLYYDVSGYTYLAFYKARHFRYNATPDVSLQIFF